MKERQSQLGYKCENWLLNVKQKQLTKKYTETLFFTRKKAWYWFCKDCSTFLLFKHVWQQVYLNFNLHHNIIWYRNQNNKPWGSEDLTLEDFPLMSLVRMFGPYRSKYNRIHVHKLLACAETFLYTHEGKCMDTHGHAHTVHMETDTHCATGGLNMIIPPELNSSSSIFEDESKKLRVNPFLQTSAQSRCEIAPQGSHFPARGSPLWGKCHTLPSSCSCRLLWSLISWVAYF